MLVAVLDRGHSAERIMGSRFVVVDHPPVGGFAHIVEAGEEIQVEHFLAERAIEALNEGILIWLSRLDVLQCDAIRLEPAGERFAQELVAVVPVEACSIGQPPLRGSS